MTVMQDMKDLRILKMLVNFKEQLAFFAYLALNFLNVCIIV